MCRVIDAFIFCNITSVALLRMNKRGRVSIHTADTRCLWTALNYLLLLRHVHELRNLTTVDDAVSICSCSVDTNKKCMHRHTNIECVVSVTVGVASLQMAGATHTLPVVIQYVLYNSREQQSPSLGMEK